MLVLAIESATKLGGVALIDDRGILGECLFERGMVHGREIAPAVESLCRAAGLPLCELGLVAVDVGPGSFTGLRVGLAAAKALAFALGCPILGIGSLDALTWAAAPHAPRGAALCALLDARWNRVYGALYDPGPPGTCRVEPVSETPEAFLRRVPTGAFVFGDAVGPHADLLRAAGLVPAPEPLWNPRPFVIARMAAEQYAAGERSDVSSLVPVYLRQLESEVKLPASG